MAETSDRIDQALADWQRERPDLDWSGAAITLRLVLLGKYVEPGSLPKSQGKAVRVFDHRQQKEDQ